MEGKLHVDELHVAFGTKQRPTEVIANLKGARKRGDRTSHTPYFNAHQVGPAV